MSKSESHKDPETEAALLDAELFLKYAAPERAIKRIRDALTKAPRSITLHERLREIVIAQHQLEEAARHCLMLARLYIERENLEMARERLLEAKQLNPRISITAGLEAIRRVGRSNAPPATVLAQPHVAERRDTTLAGDLSVIGIFDVVQLLENTRLTGALSIEGDAHTGRVLFNEGRIVGAEMEQMQGEAAFRSIVEASGGFFQFEISRREFPVIINAASNTNLILDSLRHLDEENK